MQTVSIMGQQGNCEAAIHKIKELVELSIKRKHHSRSEVCMYSFSIVSVFVNSVILYCSMGNFA